MLVKKARWQPRLAQIATSRFLSAYEIAETSPDVIAGAIGLSADHELSIWDAVVLAAAASAGCRLLLTEDMHDGFIWQGVTVTNPFAVQRHPLLSALLDGSVN